jgi:hypothetical protein
LQVAKSEAQAYEFAKCGATRVIPVCGCLTKEDLEMTHCPHCAQKGQRAHELVKAAMGLHSEMERCAKSGHAIPGSRHGETNNFEHAALSSDFYKSTDPADRERSGGLLR